MKCDKRDGKDGFCIMDKQKKNVKERLTMALANLSSKKGWDEITITDIINESKVARASFYRNFESIDELINYGIDRFRADFWNNAPKSGTNFLCEEMLEYTFRYFKQNKTIILSYSRLGTSSSILDIITEGMVLSFGDMPSTSPLRYKLYYYSGALYNMMLCWLKDGMKESEKEMAVTFLKFSSSSDDGQLEVLY